MTTQDKLREKVNGWKKEMNEEKQIAEKQAMDQLAAIANNKEMADLFNESAKMGSENTPEAFPMLKLHVANKSRGNQLLDGEEPNDGWFFHTKTKSQFKEPMVHILSISRGFYAKPQKDRNTGMVMLDDEGKPQKPKFTQLMSGVIVDDGDYQPFVMYFTGSKLSNLWEFAKLVKPFTELKPVAIPMFALMVKFSREKVDTKNGPASVVKFTLVKNDKDQPILVSDPGEFTFLRDLCSQTNEVLNQIIKSKEVGSTDSAGNEIEDIPWPEEPQ